MKKLALALVCFASVAFFASCTEQKGQPTIAVHQEEGYVKDGDVVNLGEEVNFGFTMATAANSKAQLSKLIIKIDDEQPDTIALTGTTYTYRGTIVYQPERDEIVGSSTISATVYDTDGEFATTSLGLSLNQPAIPLEVSAFEWTKIGHSVMDLTSYGLKWHENNWKSPYTHIYAADGYKLYVRNGDDFDTITNSIELANYYNAILEQEIPADEQYNRVDCHASADYNDMLVTVNEATGEIQLIHVTRAEITTPSQGTKVVISGQCK